MSPQLWLLIGTVVTATATLLGTRWMIRQQARQTKTTDAQQIIDQLQEMRAADVERHREEMTALRGELAELRSRVVRMEDDRFTYFDYIAELRAHIDERKGPPPPPFPQALMHRK